MEIEKDFGIEIKELTHKWENREFVVYIVKDAHVKKMLHVGFDIMNRRMIVIPHNYTFSANEIIEISFVFPILYAQKQNAWNEYLRKKMVKVLGDL